MSIYVDVGTYRRFNHGRHPSGHRIWAFDIRATQNQPAESERFEFCGDFDKAAAAARWHAFSVMRLTAAVCKVLG